ncbi:MAG: RidA family protein [Bacteroidia bacterium]|nr:RidA family protein [Bacteroidia bacterium]
METTKKIIHSDNAPKAIGPYSQAVLSGNTLYCSGQIALDPVTGNLILDSIEAETHQVMKNIGAVLTEAGMDYSNVVKASIFMATMDDYARVNSVYAEYFTENPPAREAVAVKTLPKSVNVEISVIAVK